MTMPNTNHSLPPAGTQVAVLTCRSCGIKMATVQIEAVHPSYARTILNFTTRLQCHECFLNRVGRAQPVQVESVA
jgi:hypothetical protein